MSPRTPSVRRPAARLLCQRLEARDVPAVFTVTSTADSGAGTLRQAILDSNTLSGADTINFNVATPATITLAFALPTITDNLAITGPVTKVTISPSKSITLLSVNGPGTLAVSMSYISFVGLGGRAITVADESLTLTNCFVGGNTTSANGSGIGSASIGGGTVTANDCLFTGNNAPTGGAIAVANVVANNSTFTLNKATSSTGGAISATSVVAVGCVFESNLGTTGGGAISANTVSVTGGSLTNNIARNVAGTLYGNGGAIAAGQVRISNATLAKNIAGSGGAIWVSSPTTSSTSVALVDVRNCTIIGNSALYPSGAYGGGIYAGADSSEYKPVQVFISSSVIAGNSAVEGSDLFTGPSRSASPRNVSLSRSAISTTNGYAVFDLGGNLRTGVDLQLRPLSNAGTSSAAVTFAASSPLRDAGENLNGLSVDGRGQPRTVGDNTDIGAIERPLGPDVVAATVNAGPTLAGAATATVGVTFAGSPPLSAASLAGNTAAVSIVGPVGALTVTSASLDVNSDGSPRTVTYTVAAPGGSFDPSDNGLYTVSINANQVYNTAGVAASAEAVSTFRIALGKLLTVTNALDSGTGSLREAMLDANSNAYAGDTIAFQAGLTGTITLASNLPTVTDSLVVSGAGATMTLDGSTKFAGFIANGQGILDVMLSNLTIQNATTAVVGSDERLTLTKLVIRGGAAGGIGSAGSLLVDNCIFLNNANTTVGGALTLNGKFDVRDSLFQGNMAILSGGAINVYSSGSGTIANCTFIGNSVRAPDDAGNYPSGGALFVTDKTLGRVWRIRLSGRAILPLDARSCRKDSHGRVPELSPDRRSMATIGTAVADAQRQTRRSI